MAATADDPPPGDQEPAAGGNPSGSAPEHGPRPSPAGKDEDPGRSLWHGLIWLAVLVALVAGLLLAVPGLHGVAHQVRHMQLGWVAIGVALEILSCLGYVLAFLQVFERAPVRFGARVALSELAFNSAVSLGGAGSIAVGAAQ